MKPHSLIAPSLHVTSLVNAAGQPVVLDPASFGTRPHTRVVEVVSGDEFERRFLPVAHVYAPRMRGYDSTWSVAHVDDPETGWDAAIVGHIQRLNAVGFVTASSCQGGWYPWDKAAHGGFVPRAAHPHICHQGITWFRKAAHVFLVAGPGHGRGGVARGASACRKLGIDTTRACAYAQHFAPFRPRINADELNLYVILETTATHDVAARTWWDRVVTTAETWVRSNPAGNDESA